MILLIYRITKVQFLIYGMKNYALGILIFFSGATHAQLSDNFADGNFTSDPAWSGTTSGFAINAALQLQLNSTGAGTAWLSVPCSFSSSQNLHWQTSVRQAFAPSAGNYSRVYLSSDQQDLTASLQGYYLQFGESGSN